jgi:ferritin-like metal-binding protein YciE
MKLKSLQDLFADEIKDLYSAETQIVKALPKMAKAASSSELKEAFEQHLEQTKDHVQRLEQICDKLDISPKGKKCKAMQGLIEEGSELMSDGAESMVLDAALIAAAQRVEHYEIAGYGCARTFANHLGHDEAASLLQQTLEEEGETDKKLTQLAESEINVQAAQAES